MNSGYNASTLSSGVPGYDVKFSFFPDLGAWRACLQQRDPPAVCITPSGVASNAYLQVNVTDRMQTFFAADPRLNHDGRRSASHFADGHGTALGTPLCDL
jgi:hypothetical protein